MVFNSGTVQVRTVVGDNAPEQVRRNRYTNDNKYIHFLFVYRESVRKTVPRNTLSSKLRKYTSVVMTPVISVTDNAASHHTGY